jgi:hypothetical protein
LNVLIIEDNLLWSTRVANALKIAGHSYQLADALPPVTNADLAIVNLSLSKSDPFVCIESLVRLGMPILAHAGHKEKELWQKARASGCEKVVSNSELVNKLGQLLEEFAIA